VEMGRILSKTQVVSVRVGCSIVNMGPS